MSTITTGSFSADLKPGVLKTFGLAYKDWDEKFSKIFTVSSTKERFTEDMIVRGLTTLTEKGENQSIEYDTMSQGWTKRYTQTVYASGFSVSREAKDDGHAINIAMEGARALKRASLLTKEILAANVFNNAFSGSFLGGDGICLCSVSHPTYAGGLLANRAAVDSDLSELAIETGHIAILGYVDERGNKIMAQPDQLIVPKELVHDANRIVSNSSRPATADRDINSLVDLNVIKSVVVNPWLTDADAWFIKTDVEKGLRMLVRDEMEVTEDNVFDTETAKFKGRMRLTLGWTDPRCVYGTPGA